MQPAVIQSRGHNNSYKEIIEDLHSRFEVLKLETDWQLIKAKIGQSVHKQLAKITRLVEVAFPAIADIDRQPMALEYFTRTRKAKAYSGIC